MLANWITLARFPLLAPCLAVLYVGSPAIRVAGAALLFLGFMLDTVDGIVARRRGESSLAGSVLDIAADRAYELALWVAFAHLGLIPVVLPLVVLARTTLTDAFRSLGLAAGTAPFAQPGGRWARALVASPWMRTGYAAAKIGGFCGLALARAFVDFPAESAWRAAASGLMAAASALVWLAALLCVLRGLPVIAQGCRRLRADTGLGDAV
ncbi:MAG TPA: CDP-alcohol phosphatidyltransferase family protein [Gemmatimonadales bacterium]|jgi:phosphatidylglycerophosphate synthase